MAKTVLKTPVKNGNFEGSLKRFKQQVAKSGTLSEYKKREHYNKPGVVRREAEKEAKKNANKKSRKSSWN